MTTLHHDLVLALRTLRKSPAFSLVAIMTLALGVGANTAIFSVVYGVLLRPLGLGDPSTLAVVSLHREGQPGDVSGFWVSYFDDLGERVGDAPEIEKLTSYLFESTTYWTGEEVVEIDNVIVADGSYFDVLDAQPMLGRLLGAEDVTPNQMGSTCVISESFWRNRLGGDPEVVGRDIELDERMVTIVGVLPDGLPLSDTRIWLSQGFDDADRTLRGRLNVLARLTPGSDLEAAQQSLRTATGALQSEYPRFSDYTVTLRSFREAVVGQIRPAMLLAAGTAGLILLIACSSLANLLLARATSRGREMATRRALGARLDQVISQMLSESLLLALLGGALGVGLAVLLQGVLLRLAPSGMPRVDAVFVDLPVVVFALSISLLAGAAFGLIPVLHVSRLDPARKIGGGIVTGAGGARGGGLQRVLVIGQMAVAVGLLLLASLMVRSFHQLRAVDPGFAAEGLGAARLYLDSDTYSDDEAEAQYFRTLLERLRAVPEIESVGASSGLPMDPITIDYDLPYTLPTDDPSADGDVKQAYFRSITPGYLETMGIPLREGRTFDGRDHAEAERVAVINETFARLGWGDQPAVGESFSIYGGSQQLRIVGVVGDVRFSGPAAVYKPEFFVPHSQHSYGAMTVVARSSDSALASRAIAREAIAVDPRQPVNSQMSLEGLISAAISTERFLSLLLGAFAAVALLVAAAGVFGVISVWVSSNRRQFGLRLALGATGGRLARLVVARAVLVTGSGLVLGLALGLAAARSISGLLFATSTTDWASLMTVVVVMGVIALLAGAVPAWRAARVDPMSTLRQD